jgi:molybdopterin molybdotransferase
LEVESEESSVMLSVAEAQTIVQEHARPLLPVKTPLNASAVGVVLAEDVPSDIDMPPFDKALMDGFAIRSEDVVGGQAVLTVIDEVTAGQTPSRAVSQGEGTRIMTGAPIPSGADAVVMVEKTKALSETQLEIADPSLKPGQNILQRAREMRKGETVLSSGTALRPQEFGLLASVGRTEVLAHPRPEVAVLCTGDELVEASQAPGPGQIRNGNGPMLVAQIQRAGGTPRFHGIARDREDELRQRIGEGLRSDILVLSGGVSAGKLDLVPGVLEKLEVQPLFHKVAMKPGKPVFFGTRGATLVFGLPGNPASSLVCFELFVRPAIRRLMGLRQADPCVAVAALGEDIHYKTDRATYYPTRLEWTPAGWKAWPLPWFGSSDLRGLTRANAFVLFPAGDHHHAAGQQYPVVVVES